MAFDLLAAMHATKKPAARSETGYGSYDEYTYRLPTTEELENSNIVIEINRVANGPWEKKRIQPVEILVRPIEDYLPPPGPYYNMMQVDQVFSKHLMHKAKKCMSCWKLIHVKSLRLCELQCEICQTGDHTGNGCHGLYMTVKTDGQVYLVLAGILKYQENKTWPIRPNMDHPLVREFYKGRDEPVPLFKKATVPAKTNRMDERRVRLMTAPVSRPDEMEAAPVTAIADAASPAYPIPKVVQPYTKPLHNIEQEQNERPRRLHQSMDERSVAEKEVMPPTMEEQLRKAIAKQEVKLAEMEKELQEVKNMLGMKDQDHQVRIEEKDRRIRELEGALEHVRSIAAAVVGGNDDANEFNKRARRRCIHRKAQV